jgi:uncharacterized damage-inducible protein DinB
MTGGHVKQSFRTLVFVSSFVLGALPAAAQQASLQAEMLKDWTDLKATMNKIASEMPEDKFTAKPTPAQQTFGERVMHVAQVNVRFLGAFGAKATAPTIDAKITTKAAAIKAMDDSFDYGAAVLKEQTDQTMLQTIKAPFIGPSSKARAFWFLLGHTWDIYGQLAVYLRVNGGVPPASQRP